MRDPERIDKFLAELGKIWKERVPDFRFMQLMMNLPFKSDPFYWEEDYFLEEFKKMMDEMLGEKDD